jgi:hypothetical protein
MKKDIPEHARSYPHIYRASSKWARIREQRIDLERQLERLRSREEQEYAAFQRAQLDYPDEKREMDEAHAEAVERIKRAEAAIAAGTAN